MDHDSIDLFDQAYAVLRERVLAIEDWSAVDVMMVAVIGMEIVETYPTLTGKEKKALVIRMAKNIVGELDMSKKREKGMAAGHRCAAAQSH